MRLVILLVFIYISIYCNAAISTGNTHYYTCNEANGALLNDTISTIDLTLEGTYNRIIGKHFNGIELNGSTGKATYSSSLTSGLSESTISIWIYPQALTSTNTLIEETVGGYWQYDITLSIWRTRDISTGTTGSRDNDLALPTLTINSWNHLVFVYSVSGGYKRIYLNGSLATTTTISVDALTTERDNLYLYLGGSVTDTYFDGYIDELAVFNTAKTAGEISQLYNGSLGIFYPFVSSNYNPIPGLHKRLFANGVEKKPLSDNTLKYFNKPEQIITGSYIVYDQWTFSNRTANTTYYKSQALVDFNVANHTGQPAHTWLNLHNDFADPSHTTLDDFSNGDDSFIKSASIYGHTQNVVQSRVVHNEPFQGFQVEAYVDTSVVRHQELYVSYYVLFSSNELLTGNKGKLIGLRSFPEACRTCTDNGHGHMSHGDGFYCAPMYQGGKMISYHYDWTRVRPQTDGYVYYDDPLESWMPWTDETYDYNTGLSFQANTWYLITQRVRLNTFIGTEGQPNGINEIWINGYMVFQESNLILVNDLNKCINGLSVALYCNEILASGIDAYFQFGNLTVWVNQNDPTFLNYSTNGKLHNPSTRHVSPIDYW
jgi:hypothetical protein